MKKQLHAGGCIGDGPRRRRWYRGGAMAMAILLLFSMCGMGVWAGEAQIEGALHRFVDAMAAYDGRTASEWTAATVTIDGLQPVLAAAYDVWHAGTAERLENYGEDLVDGLKDVFEAYGEEYVEGIDAVEFLLTYDDAGRVQEEEPQEQWWLEWLEKWGYADQRREYGDPAEDRDEDPFTQQEVHGLGSDPDEPGQEQPDWVDPLGEDWDVIWQFLVQNYSYAWEEEFGPEWDQDALEVEYYHMYKTALQWDQVWADLFEVMWMPAYDTDWDELAAGDGGGDWYVDEYGYIPPGGKELLRAIGGLLDAHRMDDDADEFVEHAVLLYEEYALSRVAWRDTLTWAVSDYFWIEPWDLRRADESHLEIPGHFFLDLLLGEHLAWNEAELIAITGSVTELRITPVHGDGAYVVLLRWDEVDGQMQIIRSNAEWISELQRAFMDLVDWIGYF